MFKHWNIARRVTVAFFAAVILCTAGGVPHQANGAPTTEKTEKHKQYPQAPKMVIDVNKHYTATIDTSRGKIVVDLFPKAAPQTVNSFVFLSREGFYDGLTFHRVEDFCIQGGDPNGDGTGGPGYAIPDEVKDNPHAHVIGALAMANAGPNTNGCQFFILKQPRPDLDGGYTVFGQVKEGQKVVDKIEKGDEIKSIKIEEK